MHTGFGVSSIDRERDCISILVFAVWLVVPHQPISIPVRCCHSEESCQAGCDGFPNVVATIVKAFEQLEGRDRKTKVYQVCSRATASGQICIFVVVVAQMLNCARMPKQRVPKYQIPSKYQGQAPKYQKESTQYQKTQSNAIPKYLIPPKCQEQVPKYSKIKVPRIQSTLDVKVPMFQKC